MRSGIQDETSSDLGSGIRDGENFDLESGKISCIRNTDVDLHAKYCSMESEQIPEDQDLCFISG